MNQPPLNPDAPDSQVSEYQRVEVIETSARDYPSHGSVTIRLYHSERQSTAIQIAERTAEGLRDQLNAYLAAVQPVVNSVEELDALPEGTILRDSYGLALHKRTANWWVTNGDNNLTSEDLADEIADTAHTYTILYRPEVES